MSIVIAIAAVFTIIGLLAAFLRWLFQLIRRMVRAKAEQLAAAEREALVSELAKAQEKVDTERAAKTRAGKAREQAKEELAQAKEELAQAEMALEQAKEELQQMANRVRSLENQLRRRRPPPRRA
jgi:septal ring factor EnvC (AmiA/AmiB activator)